MRSIKVSELPSVEAASVFVFVSLLILPWGGNSKTKSSIFPSSSITKSVSSCPDPLNIELITIAITAKRPIKAIGITNFGNVDSEISELSSKICCKSSSSTFSFTNFSLDL